MPDWSRNLRGRTHRLVTEGDLDLWLLAGAAAVFTVLGIVGVASQAVLSSAVLALLAFMATAQIRSRRDVANIAASNRVEPTDLLRAEFPPGLARAREQARDVLLIGVALSRTIQTYREPLIASLKAGARIRVMVLDPELHELMSRRWAALGQPIPAGGRRRIENTLAELTEIRDSTNGDLEIRVSAHWPAAGFNALDTQTARGQIVVQHYEFAAPGEPAPIISLTAGDGRWYLHFVAEAERIWAAGIPWPRTTS